MKLVPILSSVLVSTLITADDDDVWFAPLEVPPGFELTVFADDEDAHSIHTLTFDAQGRCVVSGPGYVKILEDRDGDGRCDAYIPFAEVSRSGLHGMQFVGRTLYGVDRRGVLRLPDADADDRADAIEPIGPRLDRGGEHGPHGIVLGPDGWLYAAFGNGSGLDRMHVRTARSPVLHPAHGNILRMTLTGDRCEVVATGLRNAYDLAFNAAGEIFTVDSDNEGELGLPFYRYPRMVHAVPGIDIGWRDADEQWPDYYPDTIGPVCDMGRGSPAGMVVYEHTRFPPKYRGALLAADWSWARIVAFFPERTGATWTATREDLVRTPETITLATHGERDYAVGFYPTDLEVAPDGSVYIALGGRDTRGRVYRLRYTGEDEAAPVSDDPVRAALALPQPAAAWSRARHDALRTATGARWERDVQRIVRSTAEPTTTRVRAMRHLLADSVPLELARSLASDDEPTLRALAADAVRRFGDATWLDVLHRLMDDGDPLVRRRAIEAWPVAGADARTIAKLVDRLRDRDRLCRHAAARALEHHNPATWRSAAADHPSSTVRLWAMLVDTWAGQARLSPEQYIAVIDPCVGDAADPEEQLEALRVLERLLDREIVSIAGLREHAAPMLTRMREQVASADRRVRREIARLLIRLGGEETADLLLRRIESDDPAVERLHVLAMLSRMPFQWRGDMVRRLVLAQLRLDAPAVGDATGDTDLRSRSFERARYWPRFCRHDPVVVIGELLLHDHLGRLLVEPVRCLRREQFAAVRMALRDRYIRLDAPVRREVLTQLGKAADPATADFVRGQVEDRSVKLAAMTALRRFGRPSDHALFLQAIVDDDVEVARVGVGAVSTLDITLTDETIFELIGQLSRSPGRPDRTRLRDAILELLTSRVDHPPAKRRTETVRDEMQMVLDWQEWFVDTHPDFSREFPPVRDPLRSWVDRRNVAGELLRRVAWSDGDAETGRRQFDRLGCARCHVHSGRGEPFGPDLTGVGKRLARRDLLDAVVLPSKFVPPRYAYTLLRLDDGRVLGGVVDGERNGVLRVRTSGDEVLEIEAAGVVDRVMQTMSPMPTGTLDPASDRDIADLFAFLSTGQPPAATAPAAR